MSQDGEAPSSSAARRASPEAGKKKKAATAQEVVAATALPLASVPGSAPPAAVVKKCPLADKLFTVQGTVAVCLGFEVGVTVTLSGGAAPQTVTTAAGGTFAFPPVPGGTPYTVTVSRGGAVFVAASQPTGVLAADKSLAFSFKLFTVQGTVAACHGFEVGVTVTLSGGAAPQTVTTAAGGTFAFPPVPGGTPYTVTVSRGGAVFVAASQPTGALTADQSLAFSFQTYDAKGWVRGVDGIADAVRVVLEATGTAVVVRLSLDAEGKFTTALPAGVGWAVSSTHDVYEVTSTRPMPGVLLRDATLPASKKPRPADAYHVLCAVQRGRIAGRLIPRSEGDGSRGRVFIVGTDLGVDVADDLTYAFDAPVGAHPVAVDWSGRVFRVKDKLQVASVGVTVSPDKIAALDLEELTVCVDGKITGVPAEEIQNVVVALEGFPTTTFPGRDGFFRFFVTARTAAAPVPYTLSAAHPNFGFTPASHVISPLVDHVENLKFVGKLETNRKVSGRITSVGVGVGGHVVRLYQGATFVGSKTTRAVGAAADLGTFLFTGLVSGKNYRIAPDPAASLSLSLRGAPIEQSFAPITRDEVATFLFEPRGALSPGDKTGAGITADMEAKILSGEVRTGGVKGVRLVGAHSGTIATTIPAGVRQEPGTVMTTNSNQTRNISVQGERDDGTWTPPKQSTLPPAGWTDEDFLRAVIFTSKNGSYQGTEANGDTRRRAVLRRAPGEPAIPWVVLTDAGGNVTCGYPTA